MSNFMVFTSPFTVTEAARLVGDDEDDSSGVGGNTLSILQNRK